MKKFKPVIIVLIAVVAILGAFIYAAYKPQAESAVTEASTLSQIVDKDYSKNYPGTPRAVAQDYVNMIMFLYNEDYQQSDVKSIALAARNIMDEELLAINPLDNQVKSLQTEVVDFRSKNEKIYSYTMPEISEVQYFTYQGSECAGVKVSYFIKTKEGKFSKSFIQYLLRRDLNRKWKIYGYKEVTSDVK